MRVIISIAAAILLCASCSFAQGKDFTVTLNALPTSLTAPTTDQGQSLASSTVIVTMIVLVNTDTSTHVVTVQDCTATTAFKPIPALTIPAVGSANSTWVIPLAGVRFSGCIKWISDSGLVQGAIVGRK